MPQPCRQAGTTTLCSTRQNLKTSSNAVGCTCVMPASSGKSAFTTVYHRQPTGSADQQRRRHHKRALQCLSASRHPAVPGSRRSISGRLIVCPYHQWSHALDGAWLRFPRTPNQRDSTSPPFPCCRSACAYGGARSSYPWQRTRRIFRKASTRGRRDRELAYKFPPKSGLNSDGEKCDGKVVIRYPFDSYSLFSGNLLVHDQVEMPQMDCQRGPALVRSGRLVTDSTSHGVLIPQAMVHCCSSTVSRRACLGWGCPACGISSDVPPLDSGRIQDLPVTGTVPTAHADSRADMIGSVVGLLPLSGKAGTCEALSAMRRLAHASAIALSCVTRTMAILSSFAMFARRFIVSRCVIGSRREVGSSASRIPGRTVSARAIEMRCSSPPETSSGHRSRSDGCTPRRLRMSVTSAQATP